MTDTPSSHHEIPPAVPFRYTRELINYGFGIYLIGVLLDYYLISWSPLPIIGGSIISITGVVLWLFTGNNVSWLFYTIRRKPTNKSGWEHGWNRIKLSLVLIMIIPMIFTHFYALNFNDAKFKTAFNATLSNEQIQEEIGTVKHITYIINIHHSKQKKTYTVTFGLAGTNGSGYVNVLFDDTETLQSVSIQK